MRWTRTLLLAVVLPHAVLAQSTPEGREGASLKLQIASASVLQAESTQPLRRADVFGRVNPKGRPVPTVAAFILLSNVSSDRCDQGPVALRSDSDFAIIAVIQESIDEARGAQDTAIYQTLFIDAKQRREVPYLFIVAMRRPEELKDIVGDVAYRVQGHFLPRESLTVIPDVGLKQPLVEVRLGSSDAAWVVLVNHGPGNDRVVPRFNSTSRLVLFLGAGGPTVRLAHKEDKLAFSGEATVAFCGALADGAPLPFGLGRRR